MIPVTNHGHEVDRLSMDQGYVPGSVQVRELLARDQFQAIAGTVSLSTGVTPGWLKMEVKIWPELVLLMW